MLRHYLMMAARSLAHHRLYSLINLAGLGIGLAGAILVLLYVRDEVSYDTWIPGTGNLYRLEVTFNNPGRSPWRMATAPFPVVTAMRGRIPQVRAVTHVMPEEMTVNVGARQFRERITFVDPNFLQVIRLPLVDGDPMHVLGQRESAVLSQSEAYKLFGRADPIGKILAVAQDGNGACAANDRTCLSRVYPLIVTGVVRNVPHNTQLVANIIVPNTSRADEMSPEEKTDDWSATDGDYGYIELIPAARPAAVLAELNSILDRSVDPRKFGIDTAFSKFEQYRLTPFRDVHLASDQYGGMTPGGSRTTVYGLAAIAILIVLIAGCNFTNLATARSTLRAREIAVRKLGGARRGELVAQFLVEAVLVAVVSLAIALSLVELFLPIYDRFLGRSLALDYLADWELLGMLIAAAIAVGLMSGIYPALVLSGFRPATSMRPGVSSYGSPGLLRSVLVVAQFAISIGLGIAALVVFRQIDFARNVNLGFNGDGLVVIRGISRLTPSQRESFATELRVNSQIVGVAYSNAVPFDLFNVNNEDIRATGNGALIPAQEINIGPEFPSLYGIKLLAGRLLSRGRAQDHSTRGVIHNVLINSTGARRLGPVNTIKDV